jgi:hypothetical protein
MWTELGEFINPLDLDFLKTSYSQAQPFPFFSIDGFLNQDFAGAIARGYPGFEEASAIGRRFDAVNERLKVQITNVDSFPGPVLKLAEVLSNPKWLEALQKITGIEKLLADPDLVGGGMHITGPGGRLDVHVDFNFESEKKLHRRLNILLYLNPIWERGWGGEIELWNEDVTRCAHSFAPIFNRCVVFETSEISFHGVTPVTAPQSQLRKSFAAYYYTQEPPEGWDGLMHSTIFRARPDEKLRKYLAMPVERLSKRLRAATEQGKRHMKFLLGKQR